MGILTRWIVVHFFQPVELEFEMLTFVGTGKLEILKKKPFGKD